jgi:hypothetical protein
LCIPNWPATQQCIPITRSVEAAVLLQHVAQTTRADQ